MIRGNVPTLPPAAAMKAAAVERRMLEEDARMGRGGRSGDASSVLAFCRFLESAGKGNPATCREVPAEHLASYAKIVQKLVEAGELPPSAKDEFEATKASTLRYIAE